MTTISSLSELERSRVLSALRTALPNDRDLAIDATRIHAKGEERRVPGVPGVYPEDKWAFLSGLATAEIALRDAGLKVRLDHAYAQRFLIVANPNGRGEIAFESFDGSMRRDLARHSGLSEDALEFESYDAYAYDTDTDLAHVLAEARAEHPNADFSRVRVASAALPSS